MNLNQIQIKTKKENITQSSIKFDNIEKTILMILYPNSRTSMVFSKEMDRKGSIITSPNELTRKMNRQMQQLTFDDYRETC